MWLIQEWNHLLSSLSLIGQGLPQQLKPEGNCRIHPAADLHWGKAFLSLVSHYRRSIKGFPCITQHLSECLAREEAGKMSDWVLLTKDVMKAFEALKQACMTAPVLVFTFLLETDASKDGLGVVLSQKHADGQYHPVTYVGRALMPHGKYYHSTKLESLALKWAVTEHFKEYLTYQSSMVWTDNNLLM